MCKTKYVFFDMSVFSSIQWTSVDVPMFFWTPLTFIVWRKTVETFFKMSFVFQRRKVIEVWSTMRVSKFWRKKLSLRLSYKSKKLRKIGKNMLNAKQSSSHSWSEQGRKWELSDIPQGNKLMLTQVITVQTALKDINKPSPCAFLHDLHSVLTRHNTVSFQR